MTTKAPTAAEDPRTVGALEVQQRLNPPPPVAAAVPGPLDTAPSRVVPLGRGTPPGAYVPEGTIFPVLTPVGPRFAKVTRTNSLRFTCEYLTAPELVELDAQLSAEAETRRREHATAGWWTFAGVVGDVATATARAGWWHRVRTWVRG